MPQVQAQAASRVSVLLYAGFLAAFLALRKEPRAATTPHCSKPRATGESLSWLRISLQAPGSCDCSALFTEHVIPQCAEGYFIVSALIGDLSTAVLIHQ